LLLVEPPRISRLATASLPGKLEAAP